MLRVKNCKFYACGGGVNLRKGKEKGKYKYNNFHFLSPTSLPRCIVIMCIRDCLMEYSGCQWRRWWYYEKSSVVGWLDLFLMLVISLLHYYYPLFGTGFLEGTKKSVGFVFLFPQVALVAEAIIPHSFFFIFTTWKIDGKIKEHTA